MCIARCKDAKGVSGAWSKPPSTHDYANHTLSQENVVHLLGLRPRRQTLSLVAGVP